MLDHLQVLYLTVMTRRGPNSGTRTYYASLLLYVTYIGPDRLIEFLRANVLDENLFLVMPLLRNGDARHFVWDHPDFDLLRLVCVNLTPNAHFPYLHNTVLSRFFGSTLFAFRTSGTW